MSEVPPRTTEEMGQQRRNVNSKPAHGQTLLRLDSTGEITSDKQDHRPKRVSNKCPYNRTNKSNFLGKPNCRDSSLKNFVDNTYIGVGSLFDSASAYIGSAATYLGSLSAKPTVKNSFTKSAMKPNTQVPLLTSMSDCCCSKSVTPSLGGNNMKHNCVSLGGGWSYANIFGAIFNNNTTAMKMPKVDRYVPPQKRLGMHCKDCNCMATTINPKLTPYNAKLLEKSRRNHGAHTCTPRQSPHRDCDPVTKPVVNINNQSVSLQGGNTCEQTASVGNDNVVSLTEDIEGNAGVSCIKSEPANTDKEKTDLKSNESTDNKVETEPIQDWFECDISDDSITSVPIEIDESKLEFASKCRTSRQESSTSQESSCGEKQLHNWYSVEFDSDVRKCNTQNTASKSSASSSQESNTSTENEDVAKPVKEVKGEQSNSLKAKIILTSNNEPSDEKIQKQEVSAVLFIRNIGKKSRPSKKKRTRQKPEAGQEKEQSRTLKPGSGVHPCSSSGKIFLSNDQRQSPIQSFQLICDSENLSFTDSDWSDSDDDDDEFDDDEFSSLENDEFLGLRCNSLLGGCSIVQATCSIQPSPPSAIDRINKEWKIHISIEHQAKRKPQKSKGKKVHFADDSSLAKVHPIIAWSHAYAAARKGPWEQYARDRERFRRRIENTEKEIKPILCAEHREKIFAERFDDKVLN